MSTPSVPKKRNPTIQILSQKMQSYKPGARVMRWATIGSGEGGTSIGLVFKRPEDVGCTQHKEAGRRGWGGHGWRRGVLLGDD